ncbi:cyclic nucleotide-gated ion channel 1-like isoform X2 [Prunus yedoensis var. nudiflora]|uniref:Cyclic nucleotide-gated ion channel 1-like isoform X2 n=1 Tax=Prunus yedoensis var. nudiflora TaxID=2094558 RepID=A0A314Z7M7_PRUYE|nr:cyclic nucleotide-gated ion channel 1-like isoform X2 [Prunus yedoensis var. nudiflora]
MVKNHRLKWDMTFAASSAFAVFIDPLMCYASVLLDDSACYYWDQTLILTFFAIRSAADLFYATDISVFLSRSHAEPFATSWTRIIGGPHTKICKILNGRKTLRLLRILPRICAALPILQAVILPGKYTSVDKTKLFYLIPIQYTLRDIRLYRGLNRSSNIETSVRRLLKAILDFLPFILVAHVSFNLISHI